MAMYYQSAGSSEQIQGDHGLQTLYLMNPNYVGYNNSDNTQHHQPLLITSAAVPHAPLNHQFVGIPLSHDPSRPSSSSVLGPQYDIQPGPPTTIPRFHYGPSWGSIDQADNGNQPNTPKGLSLSLSPHKTGFHKSVLSDQDYRAGPGVISPRISTSSGAGDMQSVILGSKYLKAAQELLDEVAKVGDGPQGDRTDKAKNKAKTVKECTDTNGEASGGGTELTTAQRQEIQMKKAKLSSMLDEVDQRYKQYHQQMQIIVASFEQAAGIGSAKSYTQLALKTILKQFKCLKTAISAQIKALNKSLGEEDRSLSEKLDGSRLKFVDHQMRQQRALQQLGMMQNNNAWKPQRGLPERAVSVLRAWLFEHFLHPYPKDSDKHMLAKQTGLTRSQVSNWFINARVRLWKPMVEEMYVEEMKNQEQIPTDVNATKAAQKEPGSEFTENNITAAAMDRQLNGLQSGQNKNMLNLVNPSPDKISGSAITTNSTPTGFAHLITSLNMEKNPKKPRNDQISSPSSILSVERETGRKEFMSNIKFGRPDGENYLPIADTSTGPGFGNYGIPTGNNFPGNSNFSLTLALPPSEGSQRAHQHNYLSQRKLEFGTRIGEGDVGSGRVEDQRDSHPNIGYEILDFQNRKQFPAQLLPDFVA